jgi:hypothetical protein
MVALLALVGWGCSDQAALTAEGGGILEAESTESELMYLVDNAAVQAAFADGTHELVPNQSFQAVDLVYVNQGAPSLEYQVLIGGEWTDWQPVVPGDTETEHRASVIRVMRAGQALRLRGGDALDFARFEFFAEAPPEHEVGFDDDNVGAESHLDETTLPPELAEKRAQAGRWQLSSQTARASGRQNVRYRGAPYWSGGRNCSGRLMPGTRELGQYLVNNFGGARSFQGYNCRQIRGSSGMSMHGTGRALDVFIPLDRGQADNDKGDPVAAYLIENAEHIGIQLIIWDRSIWSTSRSTRHRSYGGAHPHHDHLHIELTPDAANRRTAFFTGAMPDPGNGEEPPPAGPSGCNSATLGRQVAHGECVQMSYNRCGGTCNWAICDNGGWSCHSDLSSCGEQHANATCAPPDQPEPPTGRACRSTTLGRSVPHGESVQMAYDACGGTCRWATCDDGGWDCTDANALGETQHPHAQCQRAPEPQGESCYSRTLGRSVPDGDRVQMSYAACSNRRRCQWAMCEDGDWNCTSSPARGSDHPHRSCR